MTLEYFPGSSPNAPRNPLAKNMRLLGGELATNRQVPSSRYYVGQTNDSKAGDKILNNHGFWCTYGSWGLIKSTNSGVRPQMVVMMNQPYSSHWNHWGDLISPAAVQSSGKLSLTVSRSFLVSELGFIGDASNPVIFHGKNGDKPLDFDWWPSLSRVN